ncbi:hypothetical protein OS493_029819 [Desmophyllum pertusum]|uniref:Alpha-1,3-mannosyl-glycoprotein 2-beta-N-acetylglucosaminyltransferase n=1 Tax=Desmophyllum pertusum TaxID=174260 RepID=A0A9W9YLF8_9CNID|nr:hypothetical protein OS493_029819 [Desmophyllum pertusum]
MNTEGEKPIIGHRDIRRALPRSHDATGSNVVKETTPSHLDIQVYSSKENVSVVVNGKMFFIKPKGIVMAWQVFDTYSSGQQSKQLIDFITGLPDGRILCFAIRDEATANLMDSARTFLKNLGSSYANQLQWRDMWAFVTQRINNENMMYAEGFQHSPSVEDWASAVAIHTTIPLTAAQANAECSWGNDEANRPRKEFCDKFDGYKDICKCEDPEPLVFDPPPLLDGSRINLPVLIMASNRPHYLLRMLKSLRGVQGLDPAMVTVFIDGFFEEPALLTQLYKLKVDQHEGVSQRNARISQHYKKSLTASFDRYPAANFVVILEEDLDVSVDILTYFNQLLPVYENDESIYCISAWNDQGYTHTVKDPAMTYRIETMPGLGWVLSRKLYKDELEPKWPRPTDFWDWDMWMRYHEQRKDRECIIPDISRTYHFGAQGLNVNPYMQNSYFTGHALNTQPDVKFDVDVMYKDNYEKEIERLLRGAEILDHSITPCTNPKDFVPFTNDKIYAFFIRMDNSYDFTSWYNVASCLKIWDLDPRGYHKSVWRLWLNGNHVLIVGCPASPHCIHKSNSLRPIYIPNTQTRPPN